MIERGLKSAEGSESRRIAEELYGRQEKGEEPRGRELGKLMESILRETEQRADEMVSRATGIGIEELGRRRVDRAGRDVMIGTTGEGGTGYGEGTQGKGAEPFGGKTVLYDGGRWKHGESAGEQNGGLDKGTRTGRYSSIQDRRRIDYDVFRRNGVQKRQVDNCRYLEIIVQDLPLELRAIREQNFGRGIETVFVLDDIWFIAKVNGKNMVIRARGFAENGKVYIKVNNDYTVEQINGHETFHVDTERYPNAYLKLQESIAEIIPKNVLKNAAQKYLKQYKYIYDAKQITAKEVETW